MTAIDVVAFYDQANPGTQIFANARPIKAEELPSIRAMKHPIENGQTPADFKIVNAKEIEVKVLISEGNYQATYNEINQYFQNSNLIGVSLRTGYAMNYIITAFPHDETPDRFSMITMFIHLEEVLYPPLNPAYSPAPVGGGGIAGVSDPVPVNVANNIQSAISSGEVTGAETALIPTPGAF